jgi:hypothetical protein
MSMPAVLHRLGAGNVEPGYSALYCRFDLLARPQVDRRRPLGGPDIGYHIEMTRLNIPAAFWVSLLHSSGLILILRRRAEITASIVDKLLRHPPLEASRWWYGDKKR